MSDSNTLILRTTGPGVYIYTTPIDKGMVRQVWIYSSSDLCLPTISGELFKALLGSVLHAENPTPFTSNGVDWSCNYVEECYRVPHNANLIIKYINNLQTRVLELESSVDVYPPDSAVRVHGDIYAVGTLYVVRKGKWTHVGPNIDILKLLLSGSISKKDLPRSVKSFNQADGWQRRVGQYCSTYS